ncbi:hypothetical protein C8R45DRAFT_1093053 [Mycena sanguinolenta]|nr:hypothetical protein C8R45DRAFT_1093053 [Mycena sanguinolenta]
MFFIPATFVAGVFGMNVSGIGTTLLDYVKTAVPFTVVTIWVLLTLLPEYGRRESRG